MDDSKKDGKQKEPAIKWRLRKMINALLILFPYMNKKQKKETLEEINKAKKNLEE